MENKKRLIDANALVEKFRDHKDLFLNKMGGFQALLQREKGRVDELDNCIADVINAPTVDAVEVAHGRWVLLAEFFDGSICTECSVCGEEYTYKKGRLEHIGVEYAKYNYCPNCGAKMDGDGNG